MKHSKIVLMMFVIFGVMGLSQTYAQDGERQYTIALTSFFSDYQYFIDEMAQMGYIEGGNVTYLLLSFEGFGDENTTMEEYMNEYNRQLQLIIDAKPDVYVTNTDTDAVTLQALVGDTPIVFARSDDPVSTGAVADLINPGGTMTGIVTNRPHERRLQILKEIKPTTDKVLYLYSPFTLEAEMVLQQVQIVATALDIELIPVPTVDGPSAAQALETMPEGVDWIFLTPFVPFDFVFFGALATVPVTQSVGVAWVTDDPAPMYLMGYGPNIESTDRQSARIVDRILRGASPAELPVEIAENYLMVNLQAAEAIGLEIPVGILRQANRIMRPGDFDDMNLFGLPPTGNGDSE